MGALVFHGVICRNATKDGEGLLVLDRANATVGWLLLMGIGLVSAGGLWLYHRWVTSNASAR